MRVPLTLLSALAVVTCAGTCSTTSVQRVTGDFNTTGLRYWLAAPYVLISAPVEVSRTEHVYRVEGDVLTLVEQGKVLPGDSASKFPAGLPAAAPVVVPPVVPPPAPAAGGGKVKKKEKAAKGDKAGKDAKGAKDDTTPVEDKAKDGADAKDGGDATKPDKSSPPPSAISIVWLPDYCEQYAISQSNTLSSASMKIALADGWRFDNVDASNDSSAAIGKLLDTVSTVAGKAIDASKDVKVAGLSAAKTAASAVGAQATKGPLLRRTISSSLKPGLYALFERPKGADGKVDCSAIPNLSAAFGGAALTTVESWAELPLSKPEQ